MLIDSDSLIKWLNIMKKEANQDAEHYKRGSDREEAEACENRAVAFQQVIDHITRNIK